MNVKAQGGLEYLLLIGGAVLLAAVILVLMSGISQQSEPVIKSRVSDALCAPFPQEECISSMADMDQDGYSDCIWNATSKRCSAITLCSQITEETPCNTKTDCIYLGGNCTAVTMLTVNQCNNLTTANKCNANPNCEFDSDTGKCDTRVITQPPAPGGNQTGQQGQELQQAIDGCVQRYPDLTEQQCTEFSRDFLDTQSNCSGSNINSDRCLNDLQAVVESAKVVCPEMTAGDCMPGVCIALGSPTACTPIADLSCGLITNESTCNTRRVDTLYGCEWSTQASICKNVNACTKLVSRYTCEHSTYGNIDTDEEVDCQWNTTGNACENKTASAEPPTGPAQPPADGTAYQDCVSMPDAQTCNTTQTTLGHNCAWAYYTDRESETSECMDSAKFNQFVCVPLNLIAQACGELFDNERTCTHLNQTTCANVQNCLFANGKCTYTVQGNAQPPVCNNNGQCDAAGSETTVNCANDCPSTVNLTVTINAPEGFNPDSVTYYLERQNGNNIITPPGRVIKNKPVTFPLTQTYSDLPVVANNFVFNVQAINARAIRETMRLVNRTNNKIITLEPLSAGSVELTVRVENSGDPIEGLNITAEDSEHQVRGTQTTNAQGEVTFTLDPAKDPHTILVKDIKNNQLISTPNVRVASQTEVEINTAAGGTLKVKAVNGTNANVTSLVISVKDKTGIGVDNKGGLIPGNANSSVVFNSLPLSGNPYTIICVDVMPANPPAYCEPQEFFLGVQLNEKTVTLLPGMPQE